MDSITIKQMLPKHWQAISKIYEEGMETGIATFEQEVPLWENWDNSHLQKCRLVATTKNLVVAWAALSLVSSRYVYRGVAEVTVYVGKKYWGKGIGKKILTKLIYESEKNGFWTLQSVIFSENKASIDLHKKVGFRIVGLREKTGEINGVWKDNILMERRSRLVGI